MARSSKKPDDFFIRVNDHLISIRELEAWKPGIATEMGIVEMMTWIPVYLGWSTEPMCISELKPDFKLEKDPHPDHPSYPFWKIRMDLELELQKLIQEHIDFENLYDHTSESDINKLSKMRTQIEEKREEVMEADKKLSMISKLSDNSE